MIVRLDLHGAGEVLRRSLAWCRVRACDFHGLFHQLLSRQLLAKCVATQSGAAKRSQDRSARLNHRSLLLEHISCYAYRSDRIGPAGIEGEMRDHLG